MNSLNAAKSASLEDKLRSYVAALATIHSARDEVVKVCRTLVEEQLTIFSRSLGVTATTNDIKDEVYPDKLKQFGETWAWIGVTVALVPKKLWFSVGLYIDETGEKHPCVEASAGIYTATWSRVESLFRSLSDVSGNVFILDEEEYGVCAVETVPDNALGSYQDALRKAVQRWVGADGGKALSAVANEIGLPRR